MTPAVGNAHTGGNLGSARKMGVVLVRIGAPRELDIALYKGDPA